MERYLKTMAFFGATGEQEFASYLRESLLRVQKRLGGQRTKELLASMDNAIACSIRIILPVIGIG